MQRGIKPGAHIRIVQKDMFDLSSYLKEGVVSVSDFDEKSDRCNVVLLSRLGILNIEKAALELINHGET